MHYLEEFDLPAGVYVSPEQETAPGTFFLVHPLFSFNVISELVYTGKPV